ncbi:hypothetical protein D9M73_163450 [compost metagenome]
MDSFLKSGVQGVDNGHHKPNMVSTSKLWIPLQSRKNRRRIRKASRFQKHSTESRDLPTISLVMQIDERLFQIPTHRTTDAPTWQQHRVGRDFLHEKIIDANLAEFIDEQSRLAHLFIGQHPLQQSSFPTAQKTGQDIDLKAHACISK